MRVFLAEKPSQARDIANVLGCNKKSDGYLYNDNTIVTWAFGHLLGLAPPEAYNESYGKFNLDNHPILLNEFKLVPIPSSKAQLKIVKECVKQATEVVIATDADREGELIGRSILEYARYKGTVKRLWLSALDEASIKKSISDIKDGAETINLYYAAIARQRADWLIGFNYTPVATLIYGGRTSGVFSVGRVQTPTLAMIVERDIEIENFKSKDFFGLVGDFQKLKADWIVPESFQGDDEGRCLDEKIIKEVINKCEGKDTHVIECNENNKSEKAPLCLSLSELQKLANNQYGYSAKDILNIAQSLYEKHKATTYPRTDCGYLPESQKIDIRNILDSLSFGGYEHLTCKADVNFVSRVWNDKKVAESSHHAIIPTTSDKVDISKMDEQEKNVYDIIVRHYLAQFLGDYKNIETIVELDCEGEKFRTKGVVPTELGWKKAFEKEDDKNDALQELPKLIKGEILNCVSLDIQMKKTKPPAYYTDATLISAMKNCGRRIDDKANKEILADVKGIGTEATRADVIETLIKRDYVYKKGKNIISNEKGRSLISLLPESLASVEITAEWESKLSDIAKGKFLLKDFMFGIEIFVKDTLKIMFGQKDTIKKTIENPCPICGAELIRFKNKTTNKFSWMCSEIKNETKPCKKFMDDKAGKPVVQKIVEKSPVIVSEKKCQECDSDLHLRDGQYGKYWSCSNYQKCKKSYKDDGGQPVFTLPSDVKCPDCGKAMVLRKAVGKLPFWGCTGYKDGCKKVLQDKDGKPVV